MSYTKTKLLLSKRINVLIVLCCFAFQGIAQTQHIDSLWQLATTTKNDSLKFELLFQKMRPESSIVDETNSLAKKEIAFGEKNNDKAFIAAGYYLYASMFFRVGDYLKGQEAIVKAATIVEKMPANENYVSMIFNFKGITENDMNNRIAYLKKGIAICKDEFYKRILFYNIANGYWENVQLDSALSYAQKSNELSLKYHDTLSAYLPGLFGNIYLKLNQQDIAYAYYKKAIFLAKKSSSLRYYTVAYNAMIHYYTELGKMDSVLVYQKKLFDFVAPDAYPNKVVASKFLYEYYLKQGNKDSVIKYLLFNTTGNDSLNNLKKIEGLKQAKITEELRQRDIEQTQQENTESRNHDIQLAITAIVILSSIILFLLLSRSILVSHKLVEFLSVVVLLVVFEFINLLIHPLVERITHHSPVLMLMALVVIAALIVPLHHRLEHWTTQRLVAKNKAVRLEKAKKTIEELDPSNKNS